MVSQMVGGFEVLGLVVPRLLCFQPWIPTIQGRGANGGELWSLCIKNKQAHMVFVRQVWASVFSSKQQISIPTSAIVFVEVLKLADAEVCIH